MQETWRWFGPDDPVSLTDVVQAGARGVVTALHHIPPGDIWAREDIAKRQRLIEEAGRASGSPLAWSVVESLPVSEDIKRQTGDWRAHMEAYRQSLTNLAAQGIEVVCYNFMPLLDWTRTDLAHSLPNGATCMRFDLIDFVMFDIFILERPGARAQFDDDLVAAAETRFRAVDDEFKSRLTRNIIAGLPGAAENHSLSSFKEQLALYGSCDEEALRRNLRAFLEEVIPHAEEIGIRMCCHPDDPPMSLLGLPRIMSTEGDYARLIDSLDLPANGITLCSGSLGARSDNDVVGMMRRLGHRVHFLHLRNVRREHRNLFGAFHESEHLDGEVDMAALVAAILSEEERRKQSGRPDHHIPFRPDHGQDILDDLTRRTQPGYPAIGRLKGLAELRGVIQGVRHMR